MSAPTLLVVDDDHTTCELMSVLANSIGAKCVCTQEAAPAPELAARHHPDVVLLDLQMPELDGVEVLRALARQQCEATIMVTSGMDRRVLHSTQLLGAQLGLQMGEPLQKPIFVSDLVTRLAHVLPAHSRGARLAAVTDAQAA